MVRKEIKKKSDATKNKAVKEKLAKEKKMEGEKFPTHHKVQFAKPVINSYFREEIYKPQMCEDLIVHMSKGYSFDTFCVDIRVIPLTLYKWRKKHIEFEEAYQIGKQAQRKFYLALLIKSATTKQMNSAVTIFLAKNRLRMTDKMESIASISQNSEGIVISSHIGQDGMIVKRQLTIEEEKQLVKNVLNNDIVIDAYKEKDVE